jgi:phosphoribosyl 1,2-cyclic phosphodiesterase
MIRVKFWGTRGSITAPGRANIHFGGHTACVEVTAFDVDEPGAATHISGPRLIIDGGSGLATLQGAMMTSACGRGQGELHFLVSHYHWDHLIGFPFFSPMFVAGNQITFYGDTVERLQASIERLFSSTYAPQMESLAARLDYKTIEAEGMNVAGFQVRAAQNRHPGKAMSFRLQYGPHAVVYSTDHEVGDPDTDRALVELARGAQLWILDSMFTPAEWEKSQGWGHSSHIAATELALQAGVETAVLFHHAPAHDDEMLFQMGRDAMTLAGGSSTTVLMARDGLVVDVGRQK